MCSKMWAPRSNKRSRIQISPKVSQEESLAAESSRKRSRIQISQKVSQEESLAIKSKPLNINYLTKPKTK